MKTDKINIAAYTDQLTARLKEFEDTDHETPLTQTGKILSLTRELLKDLKLFTVSYQFHDKHEEILFFKHQKPVLLSQYYYYKRKFAIQLFDAFRDRKSRHENYHQMLNKMQLYVEKNKDFYEYCLSGSAYQDELYFTRHQKPLIKVNFDEDFTTGYDERLSKILGIELTKTYLLKCIDKLKDSQASPVLNWTGQKIELVELIYSLQAVGSFNNASTDVRKIVEAFEIFFNIDLGNYYRTFVGLRLRKNGYTSFLDRLKEKLEQRINEIEER